MSTDLTTVSRQIEEVVSKCGFIANRPDEFQKQIAMARGLRDLKRLFSKEVMEDLLELRGSPIGYLTDKDSKGQPYSEEVIKEALIEGLLKGARPVGNEINIISGRCYITKNCYRRLLNELPEFSNLQLRFELPEIMKGYAAVGVQASWTYGGKPGSIELTKGKIDARVSVKHDAQYGSNDQAIGKAERKALKAIYEIVTGQKVTENESDEPEMIPDEITAEVVEVSQASIELTESLIRRVSACETREDLEEINNEMTHGKDEGFIDKDQHAHVRNALNSRYRELFPVNQSQE